ncbi:MAG TPA: metallopeptidase TldD-related protein [Candidatus Angelobacter sp.]|nr:metallopeptidase TldD-related protein [Candidatus Angelobacter sp.]
MSSPQEMVERALAASTSRACVVLVRSQSVANLRWARNTLTTNGETRSTTVSVVAVVDVPGGVAAGSVTLNHPSLEALDGLVRRAEAVAVEEGPADDAADLAAGIAASPDWADAPAVATSADLAGLAPEIGALFAAGRSDGIEHFGYAEQAVTTYYLGTSTGIRLRFADPEGRLELTAKSHGRSRSTWAGRAARSLDGLDLPAVDRELRQGLAWQANRVEVAPGRHTAVLTPSAVADLMIELYWSSVARDAADGQSVWSHAGGGTRAGELVADPRVTLHSDPALPGLEALPFVVATGSSGSTSVFDNGLPVEPVSWIRDGVLENLISTRHTAQETGLPFRPAVDNLRLDVAGATGDLAEVVARTGDGLLVTCLWYNRVVDPQTLLLTGLTRDGVYAVRGGEVVGAVTNFRFNDSPVSALSRVTDAGAPVGTLAREMGDYFNRAAMPPLVVRDFNFSTVSLAS